MAEKLSLGSGFTSRAGDTRHADSDMLFAYAWLRIEKKLGNWRVQMDSWGREGGLMGERRGNHPIWVSID
ncbi:unnamed protein product [Linum trigynum]|uniref:Uncharacterized protein n=1 Tax=Linum trigynum TaxID=586398 RepID=A0AAV2EVN4_9ROSI